jgi:hypothetical protein
MNPVQMYADDHTESSSADGHDDDEMRFIFTIRLTRVLFIYFSRLGHVFLNESIYHCCTRKMLLNTQLAIHFKLSKALIQDELSLAANSECMPWFRVDV